MEAKGDKAILTFDHVGTAYTFGVREATGFAICGKDGDFVWAKRLEVGKDKVEVWAEGSKPQSQYAMLGPTTPFATYMENGLRNPAGHVFAGAPLVTGKMQCTNEKNPPEREDFSSFFFSVAAHGVSLGKTQPEVILNSSQTTNPFGLAFAGKGNKYVAEYKGGRILLLDSNGRPHFSGNGKGLCRRWS